jgi:1,4-alpha-glucan branching enzyme
MGGEFGQWNEWYHETSLDWHLLEYDTHQGVQRWVKDVNRLLKSEPALYRKDFSNDGFEWLDLHDWESSTISFLRKSDDPSDTVLVACNFTPVPRENYRVGVPGDGFWEELLNSDAVDYGGSGMGNKGGVMAEPVPSHGREFSVVLTLPPLATVFLRLAR